MSGESELPTNRYRNVVLGFLLLAYTLSFVDRSIIGIIGQSIKLEFVLTDTQLGLLGGLAFALVYTSLGIPIARAADRANRVNLISISILIWSACTALCGLAQNFWQLLLLRAGVGIGEAGLSPAAHSLISDYFEPDRRASALSIYALGIPIGAMIAAMAGGWIAQELGWRFAVLLVGLPGVLVALALRTFVRERRGNARVVDAAPALSLRHETSELRAVVAILLGRWPTLNMVLGVTVISFADYGIGTFAAPYFIRQFGLDLATVGLVIGVVGGVSTAIGTLLGGLVSDRAARTTLTAYGIVPAIGVSVAAPVFMLAYVQDDWRWAAALLFLPGILSYTYLGPCFGVIQNVVDVRRRATATALLLFVVNLIGLGAGPPLVGWLIDRLSSVHFEGLSMLGPLQAAAAALSHQAALFASSCPGGVAPADAAAELTSRCQQASALGTRHGILLTLLLYFWAALHFALASVGLGRMLKAARQAEDPSTPLSTPTPLSRP